MSTDTLPRGWTGRVRSSVLHTISPATPILTADRTWAWSQDVDTARERAQDDFARLREELDLKASR